MSNFSNEDCTISRDVCEIKSLVTNVRSGKGLSNQVKHNFILLPNKMNRTDSIKNRINLPQNGCHNYFGRKNAEYSLFSAQAANAEANGKKAERRSAKKETWKARLLVLRLLTLLSIFPQAKRRLTQRLFRRTLLRCWETTKYCANQKLGRLFLPPLMNSSGTWTSRAVMPMERPERRRYCSKGEVSQLTPSDSPRISLRLEQKTSGLFDEEVASVDKLAALTKTAPEFDDMDMFPNLAPGESLGELFHELPLEMSEADYLDSFVDLSNFLSTPEVDKLMEKPNISVGDTAPDAEMKEALSFSGIISQLAAIERDNADIEPVASATCGNSQLCRPAAVEVSFVMDNVNVMDAPAMCETSASDHDYVSKAKKRRIETVNVADLSPPESLYTSKGSGKTTKKYRERRDKNNVASRRSREIRKNKYVAMDVEADELEGKNAQLRIKIEELEKLAKEMKAQLIQKMTEK